MEDTDRICFECDHKYKGDLKCPQCGKGSGEPVGEYDEGMLAAVCALVREHCPNLPVDKTAEKFMAVFTQELSDAYNIGYEAGCEVGYSAGQAMEHGR
jgi:hypothetical protein